MSECGDRLPAKVAAEVVNETARLLAVFLVNLCRSYDPSMILVGGVAMAGNLARRAQVPLRRSWSSFRTPCVCNLPN